MHGHRDVADNAHVAAPGGLKAAQQHNGVLAIHRHHHLAGSVAERGHGGVGGFGGLKAMRHSGVIPYPAVVVANLHEPVVFGLRDWLLAGMVFPTVVGMGNRPDNAAVGGRRTVLRRFCVGGGGRGRRCGWFYAFRIIFGAEFGERISRARQKHKTAAETCHWQSREVNMKSTLILQGVAHDVLKVTLARHGVKRLTISNATQQRSHSPQSMSLSNDLRSFDPKRASGIDSRGSNRDQLSIFKIALDTQAERILSRDVRGPNRINPFRVDCGMVFISNKNFDDPGDFSPAIWSSMIPAIKQRCAIMSLSFERRHVIDYTMWLAIEGGMLKNIRFKGSEKGDLMLSRQKAYEVLQFVDEHFDRLPDLTPRTLEKLALVRLHPAYAENWRAVAEREVAVRT